LIGGDLLNAFSELNGPGGVFGFMRPAHRPSHFKI